eukprot:CAMPEP_0198205636 /NCGR_PEP_ID=MMETSP1445-20131203/9175_1 /TAXON_ID=36898 /ORGANISM="Pyramimonas sp., Strain CCMP2087" /LENGTH=449 /DNA_ID=CAMNT_0043878009 /DNA_START=590 /DNA_END=1939 /DNA_ORIENTATION=-
MARDLKRVNSAPKLGRKSSKVSAACYGPAVSVVLPVKGVHGRSLENWRTLLETNYASDVEWIFVTDSADDPAVPVIKALQKEMVEAAGEVYQVRQVVAAHSTACSQKIANQLAGMRMSNPRSKYVVFLDDDIQLHPDSLQVLVDVMEEDPEVLVGTGYPLDIPSPASSFATYCMMVYHLPLLVAFSHGRRSFNVWGGCMILPMEVMRENMFGIVGHLSEGGYSDDLIIASLCSAKGRKIACPGRALFVNHMDPQVTWRKYWNYLRRQLFVLYTYTSWHNCVVNTLLLYSHSYVSFAITLPFFTSVLHLAVALVQMVSPFGHICYHLTKEVLILPTVHQHSGPSGPLFSAPLCPMGASSALAYLGAVAMAGGAVRHMVRGCAEVCSAMSPSRPPVPAADIRWSKVMWALLVNNLLLPFCALVTGVSSRIEWAGVVYARTVNGRVNVVHRD